MFKKQTPCEKIGLKVGDRVEIVGNQVSSYSGGIGAVVRLSEDDGTDSPFFINGYGKRIVCNLDSIRPLNQTEAERRGAKFGVNGVVKKDWQKCVYIAESLVLPGHWEIAVETAGQHWHREPSDIRLDHEPEFREIPWNEATHEQRVVEGAVTDAMGRPVTEVILMKNGHYAFSVENYDGIYTFPAGLTVRVPA